jgi:cytoskeletal protein RodZ
MGYRRGVSIGEALAEARREAGLTVAQVSQRTRIRQTIIRGIEGDDYSVCGGDFYARGHIRSIAKVVAADPGPLIQEFDTTHRAPGAVSVTSIDELLTRSRAAEQQRRERQRRSWAVVAGAVTVGLALLVGAVFVGYHFLAGPGAAQAAPAAAGHAVTQHGAGQGTAGPAPSAGQGTAGPAAPAGSAAATSPAPTGSPAPAGALPPARALTPVSATAAGPGGGDNPQLAYRAIDASRATAWRTDWYTTARFGNLYPGTGLLLDMGHPVTITGAAISLGSAQGAALQIRVGAARGLAQRPPAARAAGAAGVLRVRFSRPAHGRYVLLWFARLPVDPAGTFQASVYNIKLTGG